MYPRMKMAGDHVLGVVPHLMLSQQYLAPNQSSSLTVYWWSFRVDIKTNLHSQCIGSLLGWT
jgi:hypothetical protein